MKVSLCKTIRPYEWKNLPKDLLAGLVIMAVSIPISMGYAQIAGLPAVYGLYGSVFPILLFALFSTSPQFIFGVDAAPAALVGSALVSLGIEGGSREALAAVPMLTFCGSLAAGLLSVPGRKTGELYLGSGDGRIYQWYLYHDHSDAGAEIIWRQSRRRRTFGTAGTYLGEPDGLSSTIAASGRRCTGDPSGIQKIIPKFPMAVLLMALGAIGTVVFQLEDLGIQTLAAVKPGLPAWGIPDFGSVPLKEAVTVSLSVAVVIMAETLLAENSFAQKNRYRINDNQEILAFAMGNLIASFTGCCPINGSVSRTAMGSSIRRKLS